MYLIEDFRIVIYINLNQFCTYVKSNKSCYFAMYGSLSRHNSNIVRTCY